MRRTGGARAVAARSHDDFDGCGRDHPQAHEIGGARRVSPASAKVFHAETGREATIEKGSFSAIFRNQVCPELVSPSHPTQGIRCDPKIVEMVGALDPVSGSEGLVAEGAATVTTTVTQGDTRFTATRVGAGGVDSANRRRRAVITAIGIGTEGGRPGDIPVGGLLQVSLHPILQTTTQEIRR
jgi:hypothetical protein